MRQRVTDWSGRVAGQGVVASGLLFAGLVVGGQFSWALSGVPAWLQVSVCPDSDRWLSSKAGGGLSQEVVVVMLSRMCVPVLSLATICSTDWHDG